MGMIQREIVCFDYSWGVIMMVHVCSMTTLIVNWFIVIGNFNHNRMRKQWNVNLLEFPVQSQLASE